MDTKTAEQIEAERLSAAVQQHIADIKAHMPETYTTIQARAKDIGNVAYEMVRKGLRGEPNCFWAMEGGFIKGTPFNLLGLQDDVMRQMVQFGCAHVCILGWPRQGGADGAH